MEGEDITTNNKEALSIEHGQLRGDQDHEFSLPSAHTIGHGSTAIPWSTDLGRLTPATFVWLSLDNSPTLHVVADFPSSLYLGFC
ncbi:hypothetical protein L3X38_029079 [Prunus dulcis]|uniref:Uncharacterized protein n=1 Tax=Prunus dulcis TaxID=3755 RepID=A0AAD4VSY2_PRUDU|nr:hypothetical protein L3X38_029079 [Prunus dulcis]